jgi:maltose alpha-D-glucosyltransferase/alpha-amylase
MPGPIDGPYFLTLGPHSFYWFALEPALVEGRSLTWLDDEGQAPLQTVSGDWQQLFAEGTAALAKHLPPFLASRRWFAGKGRSVRSATIDEAIAMPGRSQNGRNGVSLTHLCLVNVQYAEGAAETYVLPLAYSKGEEAYVRQAESPEAVFLRVHSNGGDEGVLYDATYDQDFADGLLRSMERGTHQRARDGEIVGSHTNALRRIIRPADSAASVLRADQSNTSVNFGDALLLKLFRKVEPGLNPDYEIGSYLTERGFAHAPRVAGAIEYQRRRKEPITLGVLSEFIHKESDAWQLTLDSLRDFFDRTATSNEDVDELPATVASLLRLTEEEAPALAGETIGAFAESARLLGLRTAEMHAALASGGEGSEFVLEPFTPYYQRSLYQSMRNIATNSFALLAQRVKADESASPEAIAVLKLEERILECFRVVVNRSLTSSRVRNHGDFHLGQVLYTGNDFVITDFEGEPARSLNERRLRRSPLRDVAGMLRSFSYAVHTALRERQERGLPEESQQRAHAWGRFWQVWVSSIYLGSYFTEARRAGFLTAGPEEIALLLEVYMLEKAVYEVAYEVNNRPDWLTVPLQGILELLQVEA